MPPADGKRCIGTVPGKRAWKALRKYKLLNEQPPYTFTYQEVLEQAAEPGNKTASYSITRSELVKEWGWAIHQNVSGKIALLDCGAERYKQLQDDPSVQQRTVSQISKNQGKNSSMAVTEKKTAYLLTWNPDKWNDWDLAMIAQEVTEGQPYEEPWRCGNKNIKPGDRVFLLKQGRHQPVGLIGSGVAISNPYQELHYEEDQAAQGNRTQYVDVEFDYLVDGMQEVVIPRHELLARFPQQRWDTQQSGIQIKPEILLPLQQLWETQTGLEPDELFLPEDSLLSPESEEEFPEGTEVYKQHRTKERNRQLVKRAKEKRLEERGDLECDVCGFNFFDSYGDLGEGYIECHHTKPVSELQPDEKTKLKDIALVCANCHRMLHRKRPWLSILQLRSLIQI